MIRRCVIVRKILMQVVLLVSVLISSTCFAGLGNNPNIAIMPFSNHASVATDASSLSSESGQISLTDASVASDYVLDALLDSDRFSIMERDQMQAIMSEHHLNLTGMVDPATAVQIGRLTGVKYILYGSVVGCSLKEKTIGYDNNTIGGIGNNQHTVIANVVARFIDVETGRIVLAARGKGESTSTYNEIKWKKLNTSYDNYSDTDGTNSFGHTVKFGTKEVSQEQVHNAIAKAADDLVYGKMGILAKMDGTARRRR